MLGLGKPEPVSEHEAEGEIARIYHEIRQTLRVSGVNLNFRTWATFPGFFSLMWESVRPNAETRQFEKSADQLRSKAVHSAAQWPRSEALLAGALGASQLYQARAALDLYHYINPKLLLLTSAVELALQGRGPESNTPAVPVERIGRGVPARMFPMEMVDEKPDDKRLQKLFEEIRTTLELPSVNSDYRTLALWPDYLERAWAALKPIALSDAHRQAADDLREESRRLARALPFPLTVSPEQIEAAGDDPEKVMEKTAAFERLLPGLILNIAWLGLEGNEPDAWARSPFPAPPRAEETGEIR